MKSPSFKKIMIFGRPGSGKSTFAKQIHLANHYYDLIHMDKLMWLEGWRLRPREDFLKDLNNYTAHSSWILEGASLRAVSSTYDKCDIVIFLSIPKYKCLFRIIKRKFLSRTQPSDKLEGFREKVDLDFIQYLWNYQRKAKKLANYLKSKYPHVIFKEIKNNNHLEKLKNELVSKI